MSLTLDLPDDAVARLRAEAARRKISVAELVAELADLVPGNDVLEDFIGCATSGNVEALDMDRERSSLAEIKNAQGA